METIHKEYQGKVPIFYFDPAIRTPKNIKEFQLSLENEVRSDFKNILIDLSNINLIDPDFVASLNMTANSFRKNGGRIGIIIPKDLQVPYLYELSLNKDIEVFNTKYEAVYNFYI